MNREMLGTNKLNTKTTFPKKTTPISSKSVFITCQKTPTVCVTVMSQKTYFRKQKEVGEDSTKQVVHSSNSNKPCWWTPSCKLKSVTTPRQPRLEGHPCSSYIPKCTRISRTQLIRKHMMSRHRNTLKRALILLCRLL